MAWRQVLRIQSLFIWRGLSIDGDRKNAPRRAGDPAVLVASSELAREELEWKPQFTDLESIVGSAWEWHRTHLKDYIKL
jgi:UDP-galactose 4-epimerase (EC 5.1.3.2)